MLNLDNRSKKEQALNLQQVTEQNIAQNEKNEGKDEENSELLINYYNVDTVDRGRETKHT